MDKGLISMHRVLLGCLLGMLLLGAQAQEAPAPEAFIVVCPIEEMVDDGMAVIVERAIEEARGAAALIFHVDTPGGLVDAAIEISNSILNAPCPTIAYLDGMGAISAGALISYSCDHIVMAPATNIGASAPVLAGGQEAAPTMDKKAKSFLRSRYRALGEDKGHSPLLGEAMVDDQIEVRAYQDAEGHYRFYRSDRYEKETGSAPRKEGEVLRFVEKAFGEEAGEAARQALDTVIGKAGGTPTETETPAPTRMLADAGPPPKGTPTILVCAEGELLTLTSQEALTYGLIPMTAESLQEVEGYFGHSEARRIEIVPTWPSSSTAG